MTADFFPYLPLCYLFLFLSSFSSSASSCLLLAGKELGYHSPLSHCLRIHIESKKKIHQKPEFLFKLQVNRLCKKILPELHPLSSLLVAYEEKKKT